nr:MAG: E6 [Gammapapillomavirus sp.]
MESKPTNLLDYCKFFKVSFFDVTLKCIFCKFNLDLVELASFHHKRLSLVWRDAFCFACCTKCLKLSAWYESQNYYCCSVKSELISGLVGKPVEDIIVRCMFCMQLLDFMEKFDHVTRGEPFHLVRGSWRGSCRNCVQK